jgi:hypothetical protein
VEFALADRQAFVDRAGGPHPDASLATQDAGENDQTIKDNKEAL